MKILIADDDAISRKVIAKNLNKWNFEVLQASNGAEAWEILNSEDSLNLAILDWIMPKIEGIELCRKIRKEINNKFLYLILLTANDSHDDIIKGLESGADDYITKPFVSGELKARIDSGVRIVQLEQALNEKIYQLQKALDDIKTLKGIIPMCAWCKKIRDDKNYWMQVEEYMSSVSRTEISHSICPGCLKKVYDEELTEYTKNKKPAVSDK